MRLIKGKNITPIFTCQQSCYLPEKEEEKLVTMKFKRNATCCARMFLFSALFFVTSWQQLHLNLLQLFLHRAAAREQANILFWYLGFGFRLGSCQKMGFKIRIMIRILLWGNYSMGCGFKKMWKSSESRIMSQITIGLSPSSGKENRRRQAASSSIFTIGVR